MTEDKTYVNLKLGEGLCWNCRYEGKMPGFITQSGYEKYQCPRCKQMLAPTDYVREGA